MKSGKTFARISTKLGLDKVLVETDTSGSNKYSPQDILLVLQRLSEATGKSLDELNVIVN